MTNYLQLGAKTLQSRLEEYGGITVTYRRNGEFSFLIVAIPGRNPVEITDQNGMVLRGQIQDFTMDIAKLKAGMTDPKRPMRGDEIVAQMGRHKIVFQVNGEDFSTSHYEPSDSYGVAWRIHTKSDRYA
jgi:hypothetical protein